MKKVLKFIGLLIGLFFLYIIIVLALGTFNDFQPEEKTVINAQQTSDKEISSIINDSTLSFMLWNVGYGGLGAESEFFFDNHGIMSSHGQMIAPPKELVNKYVSGIKEFIDQNETDFILLQEVDKKSKRSQYIDEYKEISKLLPNHVYYEAINYKVPYVPIPILEPWQAYGKTMGGLGTYLKYKPAESIRYQLPGSYDWPDRVFQLDRCISYHKIKTNKGKHLIVINLHNSAYDNGTLKEKQMEYIKAIALDAYKQGDYVVVGGDWNQFPPGFDPASMNKLFYTVEQQSQVSADYYPSDWKWAYSTSAPTNRKVANKYDPATTNLSIIDYFLLSPNIEVMDIKNIDLDFQFSDHQPVIMNIKLK